MVLKSIQSFGKGDAESDSGLSEFFIETPSYKGIENQKRLVVVGRKGAGKTAIYEMLLERAETLWENFFAVGLDFHNYPWALHDAACPKEEPTADQYASLWQFLVLVEISKLVLREGRTRSGREARKARRRLKRFIKLNWGSTNARVTQMFSRSAYRVTLEPNAFGFKLFSLSREKVPREELASSIASVNSWIRHALGKLLDDRSSYFVLLDDLDDGFSASDPAAQSRLIGLLAAARDIRNWAQKEGLRLTPVVFMRSDIYGALKFSSKNKITSEIQEKIAWSEAAEDSASLKRLIEQRIKAAIGFETTDPWLEVFADDRIDGVPLYEYMAARTHRRPRDMIKLANLCLARANAGGASKIGSEHVREALLEYSEYLLGELEDPAHQLVADWNEHVMTIRRLGRWSFSRAEFEQAHEAGSARETCEHALRDLYDFGMIGYAQGDAVVYAHHHDELIDAAAPRFEVHLGLRPALKLSAPSSGRGAAGVPRDAG